MFVQGTHLENPIHRLHLTKCTYLIRVWLNYQSSDCMDQSLDNLQIVQCKPRILASRNNPWIYCAILGTWLNGSQDTRQGSWECYTSIHAHVWWLEPCSQCSLLKGKFWWATFQMLCNISIACQPRSSGSNSYFRTSFCHSGYTWHMK